MDKRILLVEDDESLGFVTRDNLVHRGFLVDLATDGEMGWDFFQNKSYDMCIFDVMLPKTDGFSLAQRIRETNQKTPILFLTAKAMQEDKLNGFEIGGDDYITKPFSMDELVYRIEVFLKRPVVQPTQTVRQLGLYLFDTQTMQLTFQDQIQKLTRRESEILQYLVDRKDQVVKREEILIALWGEDDYFKGRSLDVFISKLRKYLCQDDSIDIENFHGVGFKLSINL